MHHDSTVSSPVQLDLVQQQRTVQSIHPTDNKSNNTDFTHGMLSSVVLIHISPHSEGPIELYAPVRPSLFLHDLPHTLEEEVTDVSATVRQCWEHCERDCRLVPYIVFTQYNCPHFISEINESSLVQQHIGCFSMSPCTCHTQGSATIFILHTCIYTVTS